MPELQNNPWNLTAVEIRAMNAIIRCGQHKVAAHDIGVPYFTFIDQLARAREKINAEHAIQAYILWNHWYQTHGNGD